MKSTQSRGAKATIAQKSKSDKRHFLRFYHFPCINQDKKRCEAWIARVNRQKQHLNLTTMKVCSDHFSDEDFVHGDFLKASLNYTAGIQIKLKNDAVPNTNRETGEAIKVSDAAPPRKRVRRNRFRLTPESDNEGGDTSPAELHEEARVDQGHAATIHGSLVSEIDSCVEEQPPPQPMAPTKLKTRSVHIQTMHE